MPLINVLPLHRAVLRQLSCKTSTGSTFCRSSIMPSSQQLRPKCQNQVGVILAQFLGSRRALDVYEPAGTAGAPLSPAIRRPAQRQRHHPFVLLWIAAQRTFQSSAQRFRPSALTQMAPGHRESIRARHTGTLRISWSSLLFWSAATRKKGEKEAHDGSVNVWWLACVHFL